MNTEKLYQLFIEQEFKFSTDSRNITPGCIFFALKGENFNGNLYAEAAINNGAAYAIVDEPVTTNNQIFLVDDVLICFQELAQFHRRAFDIPIIAIAGSNGKTTTKNLLFNVLSSKYVTHYTEGNFNNQIGVPITLLKMPQDAEIAIIEIGTNNPGEVAFLCNMVEPNYGIITNIGKEHLEGFGSLEAIAKEESELYYFLRNNKGTAFINADDDWLVRMGRSIETKVFYSHNQFVIHQYTPSITFEYNNGFVYSQLMGDYNMDNISAAISIGEYFNVSPSNIQNAISNYKAKDNRSQLIESEDNLIWLDAYNANPSSMEKAISNFVKLDYNHKILILGDMFEMGDHSELEHLDLLKWVKTLKLSNVLVLGKAFGSAATKLGMNHFASMAELQTHLAKHNYRNTAFLIKGSRGMKMEECLNSIIKF